MTLWPRADKPASDLPIFILLHGLTRPWGIPAQAGTSPGSVRVVTGTGWPRAGRSGMMHMDGHPRMAAETPYSENRIIRTQNNFLLKLMGGVVGSTLVIVGAATAYIVQTLGGSP